MKNLIIFLLCLIPWFLSSLIPVNQEFYHSLILPFFTPPDIFYPIAWTITYIGIAISIYKIIVKNTWKKTQKSYKLTLLINYLFNQSFQFVFFALENTFLGFISCLGTFISSLFLYEETTNQDETASKYLNPYVLLSLFATILSATIYIINAK